MPQQTVYIRNGDMDKWKALEHKSEFIHNALMMKNARSETEIASIAATIEAPQFNKTVDKDFKEDHTIWDLPSSAVRNRMETVVPDLLPMKMACCLMPKPCKHWVWDENRGEGYINTITGELREAQ